METLATCLRLVVSTPTKSVNGSDEKIRLTIPGPIEPRYKPAWGERRLWWAVLDDAISVYCRPSSALRMTMADALDAETWLFGDGDGFGSFPFVCDIFGLELEAVRRAVRRMKTGA